MKGCMDHIHLAINVSKAKVTLTYCLLVAALAMMTNKSNPITIRSTLDTE
jgi:hypothetical protein